MKEKTEEVKRAEIALIRIVDMRTTGMINSIQSCLHHIGESISTRQLKQLMPFIENIRNESDQIRAIAIEETKKRFQ